MTSDPPQRVDRLDAMAPSQIRLLHDLSQAPRRDGRALIRLHFGEPDTGTPPFIVEAACAALRNGAHFYENNRGRPDLTEALARFHGRRLGVPLTDRHFVVTCGAVQAIHLTMLALLSPGDVVVNVTPSWPTFTEAARIAGARVLEVPLVFEPSTGVFDLDPARLEALLATTPRVRLLIVNSPSNPTGWVIDAQRMQQLLRLCERHDAVLLSDEIYDRIAFTDAPPPAAASLADGFERLIVINGFSKTYCMTGWRVGYLITDPDRAARMARMQEFVVSHAPSMGQVAAVTALEEGESFIEGNARRYRALRDRVTGRLQRLEGAQVAQCDGTFYCFFRLPGSCDSARFCHDLLQQQAVVLAPGSAFGAGGEGWLRLCFANEPAVLDEAMDRLKTFVDG